MCTLDEASLKKARLELNEDPADRMNAVEAFRNLIKTRAPHIRCSMGKCVCVCVCVCVCADRMNAEEAFRNLIKTRAPHIVCSMGKCVCVCVCVCVCMHVCVRVQTE